MISTSIGGIVRFFSVLVLLTSSSFACWNYCDCASVTQGRQFMTFDAIELNEEFPIELQGYVDATAAWATPMDDGYVIVSDVSAVEVNDTLWTTLDDGYASHDAHFIVVDGGYVVSDEGLTTVEGGEIIVSDGGYVVETEPRLVEDVGFIDESPFVVDEFAPVEGCYEPALIEEGSAVIISDEVVWADDVTESTSTSPPIDEATDHFEDSSIESNDEAADLEPQEPTDADE